MLIMVDTNEGTDRDKKGNAERERLGKDRVDGSNLRMLKRLQKLFPKVRQAPLTCGDINIILDGGGTLAIERKRAGDFLGSISNGHIFKQVENMSQNATWSCIILEGLISFDANDMAVIPTFNKEDEVTGYETTGWHGASVRGAMYAIQWSCCPIYTVEPINLPYLVADLVQFCSKPSEHTQLRGRKRIVTFPPVTLQEDIMAAFPSLGIKRIRALRDFAYKQNEELHGTENENTPVLAEMLCWATHLGKIHKKYRPEGWGDMTITNFRAALGLQEGKYLSIVDDDTEIPPEEEKKGKKNDSRRK